MKDITEENQKQLAENKLIILYLLKNADCILSNLQILKLLYDFEGFNYYYFQHILSDLVEKNYILSYKEEEEWLYQITNLGKEILELTENMLPGIIKHKLDLIIRDLLQNIQTELTISAEYIPDEGEKFITRCKITKGHKNIFEVNILCENQSQARKIAENWKNNSNEYYNDFLNILTK